jgi:hypothetical protein
MKKNEKADENTNTNPTQPTQPVVKQNPRLGALGGGGMEELFQFLFQNKLTSQEEEEHNKKNQWSSKQTLLLENNSCTRYPRLKCSFLEIYILFISTEN